MSTVEAVRTTPAPPPARATPPTPTTPPPATTPPAVPPARPPAARPAAPQAARPRTPAAATPRAWHVRGFVGGDGFAAAATETFTALLGTSSFSGATAGADIYGGALPFGLFARVGFSSFSADGERVFVVDNESFGTGIPLTVKMRPIQIGAGIRFRLGGLAAAKRRSFVSRVTPYAGAGVVLLAYQEVSDFADDEDNDTETFKGLSVFGGFDVGIVKYVSAGLEAEFRQISGFGTDGVSEAFGEDQLGGLSIKFLIGIGR